MNNIFKWVGIVLASVIALIVIAAVSLALFLPLDKIKDFAAAELSKTLHREVKIEKASFNIFTGLRLEKISISDRQNNIKRPFISADAIELHYDLWPLLYRKIVIRQIGLAKPEIFIEKSSAGDFNFSDMLTAQKTVEKTENKKSDFPFELFVDSFYVRNGKIVYSDRGNAATSSVNNFNLSVSGFDLAMSKPIDIKTSSDILYQGKIVPLALSCRAKFDLPKEEASVSYIVLSVAGEKAAASVSVSNFKNGPDISMNLASQKISVDPLLSIFASQDKKSEKKSDVTKTIDLLTASIPRTLTAKAFVNISNLTFQNFTVDKIVLSMGLANKVAALDLKEIKFYEGTLSGNLKANLNVSGIAYEAKGLKLTGFNAHPFSNSIIDTFLTSLTDYKDLRDKIYGKLDILVSLSGRGVEPKTALNNLVGDAKLSLKNGEIRKTKILASIGDLIKSNSLKGDMKIGELIADAGIKNSIVNIRKLAFARKDFKLDFKGGVDLSHLLWVAGNRLTLSLAPQAVTGLSKEYALLRNSSGWLEVTFELTGSLKLPIPKPILEKPIENIKKKVEEKARTIINEEKEKAKTAITDKVSYEADRLKKDAAEKIKGLIKF
ncbi:MAG: AsmA family protein [Candidatus Margulisiibacteriota bacterium]